MAGQLIGAERRLAELGRGRTTAGRVQVGQVAGRRRAPGGEAGPDGQAGRADAAWPLSSARLSGAASLAGGAGRVDGGAAIGPGKGRHWGSISARRAWPLQRFNDICPLAWLTWGK